MVVLWSHFCHLGHQGQIMTERKEKKKLYREVTVTSVHPFLPQGLTFETMQHFDMTIDVWSPISAHQTQNYVVDNQGKSGFDWYNNWFLHSKLNGKTVYVIK